MSIENKPASAYAARFKEVDNSSIVDTGNEMDSLRIAIGGISKGNNRPTKTDGIKIRGTGAATKGTMARGPMA